MKKESAIERHLVLRTRRAGGFAIKLKSDYQKGLPDRLVLMPNSGMFFVELKAAGKRASAFQLYMHDKLRSLGFKVFILSSIEEVDKFIEDATN